MEGDPHGPPTLNIPTPSFSCPANCTAKSAGRSREMQAKSSRSGQAIGEFLFLPLWNWDFVLLSMVFYLAQGAVCSLTFSRQFA